jgi:Zn-dependent M28 family amino/carboxypeptidase
MATSNQSLWQEQAKRRRRIIKLMLTVSLIFIVFLVVALAWITQPLFSAPHAASTISVDPSRLEKHVVALSKTFSPRDQSQVENLDRVAEYIRNEFEPAKGNVSEQTFDVKDKRYRNVIASFGPDSPERIVVGAHYDSYGPRPGADDNASGIAGLIELAYLLGNSPLPMRIELVAFTLEEPPFFGTSQMGSAVHAASLKKEGIKVRVMFSLEMIGYFSDTPGSQGFPSPILRALYPNKGDFISIVGGLSDGLLTRRVKAAMRGASSLPVYSINAPTFLPGIDFSDHMNYWNQGYDALMITDTAFYRNTAYHTALDTADRLDYTRMAMVVQGVNAAILAVAD